MAHVSLVGHSGLARARLGAAKTLQVVMLFDPLWTFRTSTPLGDHRECEHVWDHECPPEDP
eukprot:1364355-Pyramimonas_sp.AAC.1